MRVKNKEQNRALALKFDFEYFDGRTRLWRLCLRWEMEKGSKKT